METSFEKIIRKTGMKPVECKCNVCKTQCNTPCLGTPEDMIKIIAAGYSDRVVAGKFSGIGIIKPKYDEDKKSCTFFTNGLCELHDSGLKPTVGKLSHHSTTLEKFNPKKSPTIFVLKEWGNITEEQIGNIINKYLR